MIIGQEVWRVENNFKTDRFELQRGVYDGQTNGWHRVILDRSNNFGLVEWDEYTLKWHGKPTFYETIAEALFVFATYYPQWKGNSSMEKKIKEAFIRIFDMYNQGVPFGYICLENPPKSWEPNPGKPTPGEVPARRRWWWPW